MSVAPAAPLVTHEPLLERMYFYSYIIALLKAAGEYDYDIWYNGTLGDCSKLMKVSVVKRVVTHVSGDSLIK
jgi:hypothetical protein